MIRISEFRITKDHIDWIWSKLIISGPLPVKLPIKFVPKKSIGLLFIFEIIWCWRFKQFKLNSRWFYLRNNPSIRRWQTMELLHWMHVRAISPPPMHLEKLHFERIILPMMHMKDQPNWKYNQCKQNWLKSWFFKILSETFSNLLWYIFGKFFWSVYP